MRHGNLLFCTASRSFSSCSSFGSASRFDAFGGGDTVGLAGITQSLLAGFVRRIVTENHGSQLRLTRCRIGCTGGRLGLSLRLQLLFANLLGGTMPQLRPVLTARRGKVAILCPVQIGP
jgi:hypothetical protein